MAKEKGFYKEKGLKVDIKEFNNNINIINSVLSNGANVVFLSSIFQSSPHIILII